MTRCRLTLYTVLMHHDLMSKVVVARGTLSLDRGSAFGFRSRN